jgi:hypothetical protein
LSPMNIRWSCSKNTPIRSSITFKSFAQNSFNQITIHFNKRFFCFLFSTKGFFRFNFSQLPEPSEHSQELKVE